MMEMKGVNAVSCGMRLFAHKRCASNASRVHGSRPYLSRAARTLFLGRDQKGGSEWHTTMDVMHLVARRRADSSKSKSSGPKPVSGCR